MMILHVGNAKYHTLYRYDMMVMPRMIGFYATGGETTVDPTI